MQKLIIILSSRQGSFSPLGLVHHPALWLLGDQPVIQYLVDEAKDSGVREIILVGRTRDKEVYTYLTAKENLPRNKDLSFQFLSFQKNFSSGEVLLKLKAKLKTPWAMVEDQGLLVSSVPGLQQLEKIFQTSQKPVLGLVQGETEKDWVVEYEKIAQRIFKINRLRKRKKKEEPEDIHLAGRYLLSPEVLEALEQLKKSGVKNENLQVEKALALMLETGQPVYGYHLKGEWLALRPQENWLKANLYLTLHHHQLGANLRDYLKNQHLC